MSLDMNELQGIVVNHVMKFLAVAYTGLYSEKWLQSIEI